MPNLSIKSVAIVIKSLIRNQMDIQEELATKNYSDELIIKKVYELKAINSALHETIKLEKELRG